MNFLVYRKWDGSQEKIGIKDARTLWLSQKIRVTLPDNSTNTFHRDEVVVYKVRGTLHMPWH